MKLSIIIIGDEILLGQVQDTNSRFISSTLGPRGWETVRVLTVGDNAGQIRRAVELCMADSDLTITTGGLGPTKDDITKKVLSGVFGGRMVFDHSVEANIEDVFGRRGIKVNELTRGQAIVPDCCKVIQNRYGTAPIMWFERPAAPGDKSIKALMAMPGVPFETEGMLRAEAGAMVDSRFAADRRFFHTTLVVTGITESDLAARLEGFEDSLPDNFHLAYLPSAGMIRLRLDGSVDLSAADEGGRLNASLVSKLKGELELLLVADRDAAPAEILLERLRGRGLSLAVAESCTGGNVSRVITSVPGCSDVFKGGVVSYANDVKVDVLGVARDDIASVGAVSREVVESMAEGACRALGADCSIAASGVAGPGGGTDDKPVGTVWIAAHAHGATVSELRRFTGPRGMVIERATNAAIAMLLRAIEMR